MNFVRSGQTAYNVDSVDAVVATCFRECGESRWGVQVHVGGSPPHTHCRVAEQQAARTQAELLVERFREAGWLSVRCQDAFYRSASVTFANISYEGDKATIAVRVHEVGHFTHTGPASHMSAIFDDIVQKLRRVYEG